MASTLLNELAYRPDVIERQLAHVEKTRPRRVCRAEHLEERRHMMQSWADHLDNLRNSQAA